MIKHSKELTELIEGIRGDTQENRMTIVIDKQLKELQETKETAINEILRTQEMTTGCALEETKTRVESILNQ